MGKRKAVVDLSTNPNTKKARERTANLTLDQLAIEKAIKADHADLNYYLKKLRKDA